MKKYKLELRGYTPYTLCWTDRISVTISEPFDYYIEYLYNHPDAFLIIDLEDDEIANFLTLKHPKIKITSYEQ